MDDFKLNFKLAPDWLRNLRGRDKIRSRRSARRRLRHAMRWARVDLD